MTKEQKVISFRLPKDIGDKIDKILSLEVPKKSRNFWIIEAICEKLSKNRKKGS